MIIIRLNGGLGNQMFQYAFAKAVAQRLNTELKLDISMLTPSDRNNQVKEVREYGLDAFKVTEPFATTQEIRQFTPNSDNKSQGIFLFYKLKRLLSGRQWYYETAEFQFNQNTLSIRNNTYISGYFQSEKYFNSIKIELLQAFTLRSPISNKHIQLLKQIQNKHSVSIHVRRGDYLNSDFELLDIQKYYEPAIKMIKEKVNDPVFYIFSEDKEWVENNFKLLDINKIVVNSDIHVNPAIEMFLMSKCCHNVIANSTFSWWGAWLNTHLEKIVICPKKWFKSGQFSENTYDLIPENWISI